MTDKQRKEILDKAKTLYKGTIAINHIRNLKKLSKLSKFDYNPFLLSYLAYFLNGEDSAISMAKALIYPRILGTSINTSFGLNLQKFTSQVLKSVLGSTTPGIDIEFIDQIDNKILSAKIRPSNNQ